MKTIIDPLNNKRYSVFSKYGKQLLKRYVKMYSAKIGGMQEELVDQAQEELVLVPELNPAIVNMARNMQDIPQGVKSKTTTFLNNDDLKQYLSTHKDAANEVNWIKQLNQTFGNIKEELNENKTVKAFTSSKYTDLSIEGNLEGIETCGNVNDPKQQKACKLYYKLYQNLLEKVKNGTISYLTHPLNDDKRIVLEVIKNDGDKYYMASDRLKRDKDIVLEAIKRGYSFYPIIGENPQFKDDKKIVLEAIKKKHNYYHSVSDRLKQDKDIVLEALKSGLLPSLIPDALKNDEEFMLMAIAKNPYVYEVASQELQFDKNFFKKALKINGNLLRVINQYDNEELKNKLNEFLKQEDVILETISGNRYLHSKKIFENAPRELKENKDFVLKVVSLNPTMLLHVDKKFQEDKEIVLAAVEKDGSILDSLDGDSKILKDENVVLTAVKNSDRSLLHLIKDKDIHEKAMKAMKAMNWSELTEEELDRKINLERRYFLHRNR